MHVQLSFGNQIVIWQIVNIDSIVQVLLADKLPSEMSGVTC